MGKKTEEDILQDYLEGDSSLSGAYQDQSKDKMPPAHLDKAILASAKEAVQQDHKKAIADSPFANHWPFVNQWYVPTSLAAVLVLCVGLVFTIYKDSNQELLTSPVSESIYYDADFPMTEAAVNAKEQQADDSVATDGLTIQGSEVRQALPQEISSGKKSMEAISEDVAEESVMMLQDSVEEFEQAPASVIAPARKESINAPAADVKQDINSQAGNVSRDELRKRLGEAKLKRRMDKLEKSKALDVDAQNKAALYGSVLADAEKDKSHTPEEWLQQIKEMFVSGEQEKANENLMKFFDAYPAYPAEKIYEQLNMDIELEEFR